MFRLALHWKILIATVLGAAIGLGLNFGAGERQSGPVEIKAGELRVRGMAAAAKVQVGSFWSLDRPERVLIEILEQPQVGEPATRRIVVGPVEKGADVDSFDWPDAAVDAVAEPAAKVTFAHTLDDLKTKDPAAYALFQKHGRSTARQWGDTARMFGDLFLRLLKMVSVPLIIFSIVTGVMGVGSAGRLGKMFGRMVAFYITTSSAAILTGLLMVNLIQPGKGDVPPAAGARVAADSGRSIGEIMFEQVEAIIPANPVQAIANTDFVGVISFSLAFAVFALIVGGKTAEVIRDLAEASANVMMKMTMAIIQLAPYGVLLLMMAVTATQGVRVFGQLGMYMLAVACGLLVHACITIPILLKLFARRSPWEFARAMSPALFMAFSSASGNATLPVSMASAEKRAGISKRVTTFVLPVGASLNMDGTALYEVVAVLFIANMSGIDLSLAEQLIVAFTALLVSIGGAGIPHAGLVMMIVILQAVKLPLEAQGLIIAVDRILDMCRTTVNVWSDSSCCAVVDRYEPKEEPSAARPGDNDDGREME